MNFVKELKLKLNIKNETNNRNKKIAII